MADVKADIDELTRLLEQAKRPAVRTLLNTELSRLQRIHGSLVPAQNGVSTPSATPEANGSTQASATAATATTVVRPKPATQAGAYASPIKSYGWEETDTTVKIYVTSLDGVGTLPAEQIRCQFGERSFMLEVDNLNGKNYSLEIRQLCKKIDEAKSSFKVRKNGINLTMHKATRGKWEHLTLAEQKKTEAKKPNLAPPSKDEDPGQGIMNLLKGMYDDGDDEMKRTLRKAWCESQDKQKSGGGMPDMGMPGMGMPGGMGGMPGGMGGLMDM